MNANERTDLLKSYISRIDTGEALETVQEDFKLNFSDVSAAEIAKAEGELLQEGTPLKQVQKLCDIHSALFHGATREERLENTEKAVSAAMESRTSPVVKSGLDIHSRLNHLKIAAKAASPVSVTAEFGHPLNILTMENSEIMQKLNLLQEDLDEGKSAERIRNDLAELKKAGKHYDKKDELLLPFLKRHGISGPADVMWNVDADIRKENADLFSGLTEENAAEKAEEIRKLIARMKEMIFKEEKILFPLTEKLFTNEEWQAIYKDFPDFQYAYLTEIPKWKGAKMESSSDKMMPAVFVEGTDHSINESSNEADRTVIHLPGGSITLTQLEGILRTLPMELTFLDSDNMNRYFTEGSSLFPRPTSAIGHPVFECHPPKVIPIVKNVLEQLRKGEKDVVSFSTHKNGKPVLVRYFAVHGRDGSYLGTLEAAEDLSGCQNELKKLFSKI